MFRPIIPDCQYSEITPKNVLDEGFIYTGDTSIFSNIRILNLSENHKDSRQYFNSFLSQREGDKIFTYNHTIKEWNWVSQLGYQIQFKDFRKYIKNGKLQCLPVNNKEHTLRKTKWYSLCIQSSNSEQCIQICYGSVEIFSYCIPGFVYYFKHVKDRDNAFKYLTQIVK